MSRKNKNTCFNCIHNGVFKDADICVNCFKCDESYIVRSYLFHEERPKYACETCVYRQPNEQGWLNCAYDNTILNKFPKTCKYYQNKDFYSCGHLMKSKSTGTISTATEEEMNKTETAWKNSYKEGQKDRAITNLLWFMLGFIIGCFFQLWRG